MADDEPLSARFTTLADLRRDLSEFALALDNSLEPLAAAHTAVVTGAGDVAVELTGGAATFLLSWQVALRAMSDAAALVANNIDRTVIDLQATDIANASAVQL
jgi:hypothetical protein